MRTVRNESITVPNSNLLGGPITNYTRNARSLAIVLTAEVNVDYDVEWRTVRELLIKAAKKTAGVETDPGPFVSQRRLEDSHVLYELNVYTRQPERSEAVYSELHANILDAFAAANVSLAVTVRWTKE
jgi:small-conductance mechanosensitive channel